METRSSVAEKSDGGYCLLLLRTGTQDGITPRKGRGLAARIYGRRRSREIRSSPASASVFPTPPNTHFPHRRALAQALSYPVTFYLAPPPLQVLGGLTLRTRALSSPRPPRRGRPSAGALSFCSGLMASNASTSSSTASARVPCAEILRNPP